MRIICLLMLLAFSAVAEMSVSIALKDLRGSGVDPATQQMISERLRLELFRSGYYKVMERSQMDAILKEQKLSLSGLCDDNSCDIELGRILSVEKLVVGHVGKIDSLFLLSIRLIDIETAEVVSVADVDVEGSLQKLFSVGIPALVNELMGVQEVSLLGKIVVSPLEDIDSVDEKKIAYPISYRQSLKALDKEVDELLSKEVKESQRAKRRVNGPNLFAAVASVGALIGGVKTAQSADESSKRAGVALSSGDLGSYKRYHDSAKRKDVAKSILFGFSGVSMIVFVFSF